MSLIAFCVRYPVTVIVGMILALLFGVIALLRLPIQMTPTVERPEISVETVYRGAAPQEVENEIVERQEEKLISVQDLQELVSTSYEGRGVVTLRFDWGVNKDVARLEVSEKLDLVQDIPDDAERPVIRAVSSDEETPIAWVVVKTKRDINEVRQEAEDVIKPRLERVEGVGAVWLFGGQEREVHVILDYQAMTARNITIRQVREALLRENRNTKGGNIDEARSAIWCAPSANSATSSRSRMRSSPPRMGTRYTCATSPACASALRSGTAASACSAIRPWASAWCGALGRTRSR